MRHDDILNNRANLVGNGADAGGECCDDELVFTLRDKHHTFSLNLQTVLQCLRWAEAEGGVPPLPSDWWIQVKGRYKIHD
jgi:hypothetical protein